MIRTNDTVKNPTVKHIDEVKVKLQRHIRDNHLDDETIGGDDELTTVSVTVDQSVYTV